MKLCFDVTDTQDSRVIHFIGELMSVYKVSIFSDDSQLKEDEDDQV